MAADQDLDGQDDDVAVRFLIIIIKIKSIAVFCLP